MSGNNFYVHGANNVKIFLQNDKASISFETHIEKFTQEIFQTHPYSLHQNSIDRNYDMEHSAHLIADYIIDQANGETKLLHAGYDGTIKGFKSVERMWGEELPIISKTVLSMSLELLEHELSTQFAPI